MKLESLLTSRKITNPWHYYVLEKMREKEQAFKRALKKLGPNSPFKIKGINE